MTNEEMKKMLENKYNVIIDIDSMMYTNGSIDDVYGWEPIPLEWMSDKS